MSRLTLVSIMFFFLFETKPIIAQILPNSPLAYKPLMKAKKTNMCYIIKSKVKDNEIQDTLVFNFKDFIYHFETEGQRLVSVELIKILKNYADCKGRGGLRIDFKVESKLFRSEKHCVNYKKEIGRNQVYTCFFIEVDKLTKKNHPQKSTCFKVDFFKKKRPYLDKVKSLKRKDVNILETKKICI